MPGEESRWKSFLTKNRGTKIVSLVLAIIAWYAIQGTISYETLVTDIPVDVELEDGWAVLDRSADVVDVQFRGSQEDLAPLTADHIQIEIDTRGHSVEGRLLYNLTPSDIGAPNGVRAVYISPSKIEYTLDREEEKQVPVKAEVTGQLPVGFELERIVCDPASVKVRGPRQKLETVEFVRTESVAMDGRSSEFRNRVNVLPPSSVWVTEIMPDKVMVQVDIVERSAQRQLTNLRVRALVAPGRSAKVMVNPVIVSAVLMGSQDQLNKLLPDEVIAFVDCAGLDMASRYELPVRIQAPDGIQVKSIEPSHVNLFFDTE